MQCPCCGSTNVHMQLVQSTITVFEQVAHYSAIQNTCLTCKEIGDFENANQYVIEKAIRLAKELFITQTLIEFEKFGFSQQAIERELNLPIGSMDNTDLCAALLFVVKQTKFLIGEQNE